MGARPSAATVNSLSVPFNKKAYYITCWQGESELTGDAKSSCFHAEDPLMDS